MELGVYGRALATAPRLVTILVEECRSYHAKGWVLAVVKFH